MHVVRQGREGWGDSFEEDLNPLGLVQKDGTVYLVACRGLTDVPQAYPLHRMHDVQLGMVTPTPIDFDLARFIEDTHGLAHPPDGMTEMPIIDLVLRVHPRTLYHFHERPLCADQEPIEWPPKGAPECEWGYVRARLPYSKLLVAFLLSMGPWVEVVAPQEVRDEIGRRSMGMAEHYLHDQLAKAS